MQVQIPEMQLVELAFQQMHDTCNELHGLGALYQQLYGEQEAIHLAMSLLQAFDLTPARCTTAPLTHLSVSSCVTSPHVCVTSLSVWCDVWVWASALQPHSHTHTHSLSLVPVVMIKSKELKTKISLTHSLILSLCNMYLLC